MTTAHLIVTCRSNHERHTVCRVGFLAGQIQLASAVREPSAQQPGLKSPPKWDYAFRDVRENAIRIYVIGCVRDSIH